MPLPNFFIVGTGKAGTTSLYGYLKQHPDIYMSPVKEPGYFASEIRAENLAPALRRHVRVQSRALATVLDDGAPNQPLGWITGELEEYLRLFQGVRGEKAIGEASAAYLWSATAAENMRAAVPGARILMILRDPAERAFSQYLQQVSVGLTRATFREHLEECARGGHTRLSHLYPFFEIGLYHDQVKRFVERFPRDQIRIDLYEEAWRDPSRYLAGVFEFLGVEQGFAVDFSHRAHERRGPRAVAAHYFLKKFRMWYPLRAMVPAHLRPRFKRLAFREGKELRISAADRAFLVEYCRADIERLAGLLGRDLSGWLCK